MGIKKLFPLLLVSIIFSILSSFSAFAQAGNAPDNVNWTFDFSGTPYATSGAGKFDKFGPCGFMLSGGPILCKANNTYDLSSTWIDQDTAAIAFKITANNFSNAAFCNGTENLSLWVEFDADSAITLGSGSFSGVTGCGNRSGFMEACMPGADYQIEVNQSGFGVFKTYSGTNPQCILGVEGACFNHTPGIPVYVNISRINDSTNTNIPCSRPYEVKVAVLKKNLTWSVFKYSVASFNSSTGEPIDQVGEASGENFGTMDFMQFEGEQGFMFKDGGCFTIGNQSACTNTSQNGNFSCTWNSQFNHCETNFADSTTYGCSQFCGACTTSGDCSTGAKGTCQWSGSFCMEDFSKFRAGGNCDSNCFDCFTQAACEQSSSAGGCSYVTDPATNNTFCAEKGFTIKACGYESANTSCYTCPSQAACAGISELQCTWDTTGNFCRSNETGYEVCFNLKDDNNDGKVDCDDPKCSGEKLCGSEFDKKLMTDKPFVTLLTQAGICSQTSAGLDCDKEAMMMFEFAKDMKPGPPIELAFDGPDGQLALDSPHLDIMGIGLKDMGSALGLGIGLVNTQNLLPCSLTAGRGGYYIYYIDTDANPTTGCVANISGVNISGVEYKLLYNISTNGSQGNPLNETRKAYRCVTNQSSTFGQFPATLGAPKDPMNPSQQPLCNFGAAITIVKLKDIGNPSSNFVFSVASFINTSIDTNASDYIINASYTPGTVEYRPDDCVANPFACGAAFAQLGKGKFVPFEECLLGTGDEDLDGNSNCDDTDCVMAPWCASNRDALIGNDKTAPKTKVLEVKSFGTVAFLSLSTDEPTNMTFFFYNTSSGCLNQTVNVSGTRSKFGSDKHKPWHDLPFDRFALNESGNLPAGTTPLASSTTYYYRVKNCDLANNCAVSACLNFTTSSQSSNSIKFGFEFEPALGSTQLSGIKIDFKSSDSSSYTSLTAGSLGNITVASNVSLRFRADNATIKNQTENWIIELKGADLAKATQINLTGALVIKNDTAGGMYVGMNGTKWQEIAQVLGVDYIRLNISESGDRLVKCDENLVSCTDVTGNATRVEGDSNHTIWDIPTYGMGGFSAYTSSRVNVTLGSDKTIYKCYPYCTVYYNLTNRNETLASTSDSQATMNLTLNNTIITSMGSSVTFNLSLWNFSTQDWQVIGFNTTNMVIQNYNFKLYNGSNPVNSTLQFRIDINLSIPDGIKWLFTVNVSNGTMNNTQNFSDVAYLDSINLSMPENNNLTTNITPEFRFTLFSYNETRQNCTLFINNTPRGRNDSVTNASPTTIKINQTISSGQFKWNVSCTPNGTMEQGFSLTRNFTVSDSALPIITSETAGSITSTSATITWNTNELANSSVKYGTSSTSLGSLVNISTQQTSHSVVLSGLTASTTYYFNVTSCDAGGNCNTTGPFNFATTSAGSSGSSGGGGGGGGGGAVVSTTPTATQVWQTLPKGATVMKVSNAEIGLREITIDVKNARSNTEIKVSKLSGKPASVSTPANKVYQYLQVDKTNLIESDLNKVTIKFRVEKKWLTDNNVAPGDVVLLRYVTGWDELKTSATNNDQLYYYYLAESPGLSVFSISSKASAQPTTSAAQQQADTGAAATTAAEEAAPAEEAKPAAEIPKEKGFEISKEIIIALVAIVVVVLGVIIFLVFKRKKADTGMGG